MVIGSKAQYQRAIDKAAALRLYAGVETARIRQWTVRSESGDRSYTVRLNRSGELVCSCPAGVAERPCKHGAAIWMARLRDSALGTSTPAPAPAPAPVPAGELPVAPRRTERGVIRTEEEERLLDQMYGPRPAN